MAAAAGALAFPLWKWRESIFGPPTVGDHILASNMEPISQMRWNKLTSYYEKAKRNLEDIKREIPNIPIDLDKPSETASALRDWCNLTLRKRFYRNSKESKDEFNLASKYCVMSVKDKILEVDDLKLLEKPEEYKSSFRRNKNSIYHRPSVHGMEFNDVNDEGGARMLESWCTNSLSKTYSFKNYWIFRYSQEWCAQRIK